MKSYTDFRDVIINGLVGIKVFSPEQAANASANESIDVELATLGIDSMAVIDLCMDIEEHSGREILIEQLIDNPTINKLAKFLSEH
jgi:acyl carrier protein